MDIIKDQEIILSSTENNKMRPCSLGVRLSPPSTPLPASSLFNFPSYTFTQSYGQPFKTGNQWIPYNKNLSRFCQ